MVYRTWIATRGELAKFLHEWRAAGKKNPTNLQEWDALMEEMYEAGRCEKGEQMGSTN